MDTSPRNHSPFSWKSLLISLLLVGVLTRFWNLWSINEYVFDEVYHAFTAKMYALDRYEAWVWWESPPDGVAYEWTHPPLAKVIMSWGVMLFGGPGELPTKIVSPDTVQTPEQIDAEKTSIRVLTPNPLGWRFFSAAFGVVAIFMVYLLASSLFRNAYVGLFSAFLFTFDLLPLVQSRTAMNDIFAVTFMLCAFYFFTRRKELVSPDLSWVNWLLTSLFLGAAIASKWTSLFTIGIFGVYQLGTILYSLFVLDKVRVARVYIQTLLSHGFLMLSCFIVLPYVVYMLSYMQLFTTKIHDYKGNSLMEAFEQRTWETERDGYVAELKQAQQNRAETLSLQQKIDEKNRQIAFWNWLSSVNPHFAERYYIWWGVQKQMWWYHTNLVATHNYTSQWWTWPLDIRPVWFYVKYCTDPTVVTDPVCAREYAANGNTKAIADIYTMGNPFIFWLIFPTLIFLSKYLAGRHAVWFYALLPASAIVVGYYALTVTRSDTSVSIDVLLQQGFQAVLPQIILFSMLLLLFLTFLNLLDIMFATSKKDDSHHTLTSAFIARKDFIAVCLFLIAFAGYWLPWARSPRIMFFYHFFPPVTFFYPILGYVLYRIFSHSSAGRNIVIGYCVLVAISFVYFYPHVTGWLVSEPMREQYFWLNSWK